MTIWLVEQHNLYSLYGESMVFDTYKEIKLCLHCILRFNKKKKKWQKLFKERISVSPNNFRKYFQSVDHLTRPMIKTSGFDNFRF